jgi:hypothetical protein
MELNFMSSEQEKAREKLIEDRTELVDSIYELINNWMLKTDARIDPDFAIGIVIGAVAQATGDYSAAHRILNGHSDEWSRTLSATTAQAFNNAHAVHYAILKSANRNISTDDSLKN